MSLLPRLILVLCLLLPAAALAQADADARAQIDSAKVALAKAIHAKDFATIEKFWSPDLLVNSPSNRILTRNMVFAAMREDKLDYSTYKVIVESFHVYGELAVEMGNETLVPASGPEAGTTLYRRFTDIWQHGSGSWLLVARQATFVDPAKVHYTPPK